MIKVKIKHMKILLVILLIFCGTAIAENLEVELHLTSYHFDDDGYEEDNYGLGVSYFFKERWSATGGIFNNSYDDTSIYLGVAYTYDLCSSDTFICTIGALAGLVTGYEDNIDHAGDLYPIILPEFKIGYQQYFLKSRFIPDLGDNASAVFTFSAGREF
ncbi:MAG: hypothetical protein GKR92_04820 [Gammaproteobacteria bacterium]|nr:MAG: hypothetical protein GKR92_04820 [Gammaproteobacteria bacterium]